MYDYLAANLRHERRAADVTQEQLAARTGLSRSYLSNLERGLRPVEGNHVTLIADALGVSTNVLLRCPRKPRQQSPSPVCLPASLSA